MSMKPPVQRGLRPMLLMLVALLHCIPAGKACLQCDPTFKRLIEDFSLSDASVTTQLERKNIIAAAYGKINEISQKRGGVIDRTTLYRASTEFQSEFNRFQETKRSGHETIRIMDKGSKILDKHLATFIHGGLCPNKCGLLYRRVMDCFSCRFKIHNCSTPSRQLDCGEYSMQAEEGDQAVLDCFLPWHSLVLGRPEYHYSWAPGTKKLVESDFKVLVVTKDSSVALNQLNVDEQGTYRCSLQDKKGTVFSQVTFLLNVTALPAETLRTPITLPSLPGDDSPHFHPSEKLLEPIIIMVTTLSLVVSVGLVVILGMQMKHLRDVEELRRGREENTV